LSHHWPVAELPSGTVTFLFTDIEGSTRLLQRLGDEYAGVLRKHRQLVRPIFAQHGGYEVDTQGDAFFVAFARARDAVTAAAQVQRAAGEEDVRVRIGIHSAEAVSTDEGYVGLGVHRAARVCAAAHGGQVVLSQTTRELLHETPLEEVELRDLGEHRLKDLAQAQRLYQLVVPGLDAEFPPLRSLEGRPTNLPLQPTPLVGRGREIVDVTELLRQADIRLVTLTGTGGTGKTRLAAQAAAELLDDFADGVFFVGLAALADPDLVVPTIAQTLGVRESSGRPLADALRDYVRERELLLVLDNFEHLLDAGPALGELVADAGRLNVLATSRGALHLAAERVYPVPPLETPDEHVDVERLLLVDSVALFVSRARAVRPEFTLHRGNARAVAGICKTLDGLPLAIELAAARVAVLPPAALLERLDNRFKLLTGGPRDAPTRHQALRTAIDWSYDLLEPNEQALFARLSVFAGSFTLEAAEHILGAEAVEELASLIDKSLVRLEGSDETPRFRMLNTIREYALQRLRAADIEHLVRNRHLEHYLRLAEQAYAERYSTGWRETIAELAPELDNLRAAADWAAEGDAERELELVGALAWFWINQTTIAEAEDRLAAALGHTGTRTAARARALLFAGQAARARGKGEQAVPLFEEALAAWRELGDAENVSNALDGLGGAHFQSGHDDLAQRYFEESLELRQKLGHRELVTRSLLTICQLIVSRGDVDQAEPIAQDLYRRALDASDWAGELAALALLAGCALIRGDFASAEQRYARAAMFAWEHGDRRECATQMQGLAIAVSGRGDYERALRIFGATLAERGRRGLEWNLPFWMRLLDEHLGRARAALGPAAADAAEAEGHALPFERAVEEAVQAWSSPRRRSGAAIGAKESALTTDESAD
jgi:predicted ATPase/class 3 adenylate cyclase